MANAKEKIPMKLPCGTLLESGVSLWCYRKGGDIRLSGHRRGPKKRGHTSPSVSEYVVVSADTRGRKVLVQCLATGVEQWMKPGADMHQSKSTQWAGSIDTIAGYIESSSRAENDSVAAEVAEELEYLQKERTERVNEANESFEKQSSVQHKKFESAERLHKEAKALMKKILDDLLV